MQLEVAEGGNMAKALARRLEADTLTPNDKERLELARKLRKARRAGRTIAAAATEVGVTERLAQQFMTGGVYKVFVQYLDTLERGDDDKLADLKVRKAKQRFAGHADDAVDYIATCFERNPEDDRAEKGLFVDDAKAMWATDKVAKGLGLLEPERAVRPVININIAHIAAEQAQVAEDDAIADANVIDVTPEPAPA